ncbi:MAG: hypothetical protein JRN06_06045 [Nitrososphaerota archaeon]|nr:hypothetical protein [Nitrososphaerota archaeon]
MAECWSTSNAETVYDSSRATLDRTWMKIACFFAQKEGMSVMVPFFTSAFASYSLTSTSPSTSTQILALQQERTQVFYMCQDVTSGKADVISTATTTSTSPGAAASHTSSTGIPEFPFQVFARIALTSVVVLSYLLNGSGLGRHGKPEGGQRGQT